MMASMILRFMLLLLTDTAGMSRDGREQILQDFDLSAPSSDAVQNTLQRTPAAHAAQTGFGIAAESGRPLRDTGADGLFNLPGLPQLPSNELEVEVQRTSRVAAYLAQDAAVLSKELATLQASLRGHGLEALPVNKEQNQLTSLLALDAALSKAGVSAPGPTASKVTATSNSSDSASKTNSEANCLIMKCDQATGILTFYGRYPLGWGIVNWILVVTLAVLTFLCCYACVSKKT
eukprot:TRINITY_DN4535_c0_g1_i2.p1 TRINITY_DN4535_c0_g1~~TRINITY_DN4535_c0_g1_i2.p1  ORF type:complete len:265 (+),score=41.63 TRINITY_DN4535_c0_g1_i2:95-796(+)